MQVEIWWLAIYGVGVLDVQLLTFGILKIEVLHVEFRTKDLARNGDACLAPIATGRGGFAISSIDHQACTQQEQATAFTAYWVKVLQEIWLRFDEGMPIGNQNKRFESLGNRYPCLGLYPQAPQVHLVVFNGLRVIANRSRARPKIGGR